MGAGCSSTRGGRSRGPSTATASTTWRGGWWWSAASRTRHRWCSGSAGTTCPSCSTRSTRTAPAATGCPPAATGWTRRRSATGGAGRSGASAPRRRAPRRRACAPERSPASGSPLSAGRRSARSMAFAALGAGEVLRSGPPSGPPRDLLARQRGLRRDAPARRDRPGLAVARAAAALRERRRRRSAAGRRRAAAGRRAGAPWPDAARVPAPGRDPRRSPVGDAGRRPRPDRHRSRLRPAADRGGRDRGRLRDGVPGHRRPALADRRRAVLALVQRRQRRRGADVRPRDRRRVRRPAPSTAATSTRAPSRPSRCCPRPSTPAACRRPGEHAARAAHRHAATSSRTRPGWSPACSCRARSCPPAASRTGAIVARVLDLDDAEVAELAGAAARGLHRPPPRPTPTCSPSTPPSSPRTWTAGR